MWGPQNTWIRKKKYSLIPMRCLYKRSLVRNFPDCLVAKPDPQGPVGKYLCAERGLVLDRNRDLVVDGKTYIEDLHPHGLQGSGACGCKSGSLRHVPTLLPWVHTVPSRVLSLSPRRLGKQTTEPKRCLRSV